MNYYPNKSISDLFSNITINAKIFINEISENDLLNNSIDDLKKYVESNILLPTISVHGEPLTKKDVKIITRESRFGGHIDEKCVIVNYSMAIDNGWLFGFLPSRYSQRGGVGIFDRNMFAIDKNLINGRIIFSVDELGKMMPDKRTTVFDEEFKKEYSYIEVLAKQINAEIDIFNISLKQNIEELLNDRRQKVKNENEILESVNIDIFSSIDQITGNNLIPIKLVEKMSNISQMKTNYVIPSENLNLILRVIRNFLKSSEAQPSAYKKLHEEELIRDTIIHALNANFIGQANGEAFRKNGKTDISIIQDNKSAFIAECKIWSGEESFKKAFDQLFGYATWRDAHLALLVFNLKNQNYIDILKKIPSVLQGRLG